MTDLENLERLLAAATPAPWLGAPLAACATLNAADAELVVALRNAAPELVRAVREGRSLLAVIHRDGGHHTERVGFAQSTEDARELVIAWLARDDEGDDT